MTQLIVSDRPRGESSASAKLTESDVLEIRRLWPQHSLRELATNHGVSHTCIRRAVMGRTWSHIKSTGREAIGS